MLYDVGMSNNSIIKIGDTVKYRGLFGGPIKEVKVEGLTLTQYPNDKYGTDVSAVGIESVMANKVMFSLDDGKWCYAKQIVIG